MKILVIDGHPYEKGLASRLAKAYAKGAKSSDHSVKLIAPRNMQFDPILRYGYRKRMEMEKDLVQAQEDIIWSQHVVVASPIWWMNMPALLKGFFDRILLPKFAYAYGKRKFIPKGLLKGRSVRMIYTQGAPRWATAFAFFDAHWILMKYGIFKFTGLGPVKRTVVGRADKISEDECAKWINKVYLLGKKGL